MADTGTNPATKAEAGRNAKTEPGHAVVIGGGISGLVAAWDLARAGWSVTVHEASDRWGGKIWSSLVGDRLIDAGPDSMLARVDAGRVLCEELGLADELGHPVSKIPALLCLSADRSGDGTEPTDPILHRLPEATVMGVPTDLSVLAGGVISPDGLKAAAADAEADWDPNPDHDPSVGEVCRARLGDEITERLIDPLLGGINASHIDHLSLRAAAPQLAAALDTDGSLIGGLANLRARLGATLGSARKAPVFYGLPGGLARIVDRLVEELTAFGPDRVDLRLNSPIQALDAVVGDTDRPADAVIITTPAFATAPILASSHPDAAAELADIDYASVAQVTMEFPSEAIPGVIDGSLDTSGILFPRVGGTVLTACTIFSAKWAHYQAPGRTLIRLTSGRYRDERIADLDDDTLATTLLDELRQVITVDGDPDHVRVQRWTNSLPQYRPGHRSRVARVRELVADGSTPIRLAGATYDGIGIPACITSGRTAAADLIEANA